MRDSKARVARPRLPSNPQSFEKPLQKCPVANGILYTWKQISDYSGRGVRTLQRWERDFGFPVHRPDQRHKSAVVTTRREVDEWFRTRPLKDSHGTVKKRNPQAIPKRARELTESAHRLEVEAKRLHNSSIQMNQRVSKALETARKKCS